MELTKKQKAYVEYYCDHPLLSDRQCAKDLGISTKQICIWNRSEEFQAEITKELDKRWRSARKMAQNTMLNLAENGDRQAAEFLLKTTGLNPEQKVELNASVNTIKVSIEEDD